MYTAKKDLFYPLFILLFNTVSLHREERSFVLWFRGVYLFCYRNTPDCSNGCDLFLQENTLFQDENSARRKYVVSRRKYVVSRQ